MKEKCVKCHTGDRDRPEHFYLAANEFGGKIRLKAASAAALCY